MKEKKTDTWILTNYKKEIVHAWILMTQKGGIPYFRFTINKSKKTNFTTFWV